MFCGRLCPFRFAFWTVNHNRFVLGSAEKSFCGLYNASFVIIRKDFLDFPQSYKIAVIFLAKTGCKIRLAHTRQEARKGMRQIFFGLAGLYLGNFCYFCSEFLTSILAMNEKKINVAIDGTSSSGKSTMAKALAKAVGYTYIDTGAMYRSVALFCLRHGLIAVSYTHLTLPTKA